MKSGGLSITYYIFVIINIDKNTLSALKHCDNMDDSEEE